jgi:tetratricopeptide (TPR) repeat protein
MEDSTEPILHSGLTPLDFHELVHYAEVLSADNHTQVGDWCVLAARRSLAEISSLAGRTFDLQVIPPGSSDSDLAWSETPQTICIGVGFLRRLDEACLAFAGYLSNNFVVQNMGIGPSVPLPLLKAARDFPEAALQLYSANMLPNATDPVGNLRSDYDSILASFPPCGDTISLADIVRSEGHLAKRFLPQDWRTSLAVARNMLKGDPLPHLLLLYARLLSDALALLLAHEASHILLGHLNETGPTYARSREDEVAADASAVLLLAANPSFNLRSASLLFAFLSDSDQTQQLETLAHPFAADRLTILAAAAASFPGKGLEDDLNIGVQVLRKPLQIEFEDHLLPENATAKAWTTSGLYYQATAILEVQVTGADACKLTSLGEDWEIYLDLVIRNRVHPDQILRAGTLLKSLEGSGHSTIGPDGTTYFLTVGLDAPPSWWLDISNGTLAAERAAVRHGSQPPLTVWTCTDALENAQMLQHFREVGAKNHSAAVRVAHRAIKCESPETATALLLDARDKFGDQSFEALPWLADHLLSTGEYDCAAQVLENAMRSSTYVPVGFRGLLARANWRRFRRLVPERIPFIGLDGEALRLYEDSFDLALRESNCSAETPEHKAASELVQEILSFTLKTKAAGALVESARSYSSGRTIAQTDPHGAASNFAQAASVALQAASDSSIDAVYFRQTAGEALLAEAGCQSRNFSRAKECFRQVLQSDPSFVPALVGLAKCSLEESDYSSVRETLAVADRIAPNHPFLKDIGPELRRRLNLFLEPKQEAVREAFEDRQPEKVLALVQQMLQIDPAFPEALYLRALANYELSNLAAARADIEAYLRTAGEIFGAAVLLGQILVEMAQFAEAWERLTMAIGCAQKLPQEKQASEDDGNVIPYSDAKNRALAKAARAVADHHLGAVNRALRNAEAAAIEYPTCGILLLDCAEVMRLAGKTDTARPLAQQALNAPEWPLTQRQAEHARSLLN